MTYDMREAISKVDNIPLVKESIPELTKLANGFDPSIPGYLALGRLYQITNLAESAQAAKPPQGTIKDKTTQAAGLMALMGGRGQMAAQNSATQTMRQPGPVPQNTPEPEMQAEVNPEEMMGMEMGMADGGITSMNIDPRMFNFDGGGIVAFANDLDKKKQQVKEKDKDEGTSIAGDLLRAILEPYENLTERQKLRREFEQNKPGFFESQTEAQKRERAAKANLTQSQLNQLLMGAPTLPPVTPEQNVETARETQRLGLNAAARQQPAVMNENPELVPGVPQQPPPAPPKPPMGGINNGKTPVPGANIPAIGAGIPQALPENKFLTATEGFINQKPEVFNEATETAKINARNEAAGIGTYAKVMREQQQGMRDQFERSRPTMNEGIISALRAYAKPGARAGDVGGEFNEQSREDRESRMQFAQDQFKVTEAIEKLEEARRTGNVDKIAAAEAAVNKANADLRNHQMTAAASAASTLSADQRSAADRAQTLQIENAKLQVEKARIAAMHKDSETIQMLKDVEALQKAGLVEEAKKKLENYAEIKEAGIGARYKGKNIAPTVAEIAKILETAYSKRNAMDQMTLSNKNAKPADIARAKANIERTKQDVLNTLKVTGGGGAGGGGAKPPITEAEYKALPKGATYTAPDGVERIKG